MNLSKWLLYFCRVWIRLINLHLLLLGKCDKSKHLRWIWCLSNALGPAGLGHWTHQNSVRMHWICLILLAKVNTHLLTSTVQWPLQTLAFNNSHKPRAFSSIVRWISNNILNYRGTRAEEITRIVGRVDDVDNARVICGLWLIPCDDSASTA